MPVPPATEHRSTAALPAPPAHLDAPIDPDELRRARAAIASIERVQRQLAETQRSLERFITRAAEARTDGDHPPVRMRTL